MLMLSALIIDSSSNSLGTKANDLFVEVAFLMAMAGFKNHVRQPRARRYKPIVKFRPPQRALSDGAANHWPAPA
jgi:hypothetical protein